MTASSDSLSNLVGWFKLFLMMGASSFEATSTFPMTAGGIVITIWLEVEIGLGDDGARLLDKALPALPRHPVNTVSKNAPRIL